MQFSSCPASEPVVFRVNLPLCPVSGAIRRMVYKMSLQEWGAQFSFMGKSRNIANLVMRQSELEWKRRRNCP